MPYAPPSHTPAGQLTEQQAMKFYNSRAWRTGRLDHLNNNPLCEDCFNRGKITEATEVHHDIRVRTDISKALDSDHWHSLCNICHKVRTTRGE